MSNCHFRICSTLKSFLPLFLLTYFLLLMILLLKVPTDIAPNTRNPPAFLAYTTFNKPSLKKGDYLNHHPHYPSTKHNEGNKDLIRNGSTPASHISINITKLSEKSKLIFQEPPPLPSPLLVANKSAGSFYALNEDIFIYSAYYDNRKQDTFIRLLTLSKQASSRTLIYCHFEDEIYKIIRTASRYEMCENHNKFFGGYVFSCEVPEFVNTVMSTQVTISYRGSKEYLKIPLRTVQPSKDRVKFVDSYVGEISYTASDNSDNNIVNKYNDRNSNLDVRNIKEAENSTSKIKKLNHDRTLRSLSFAVCVPPLFDKISPHRLVEFIELTFLLGAEHIFFYEYKIGDDVQRVLSHYAEKGLITLVPWSLPSNVASDKIWYNGQLLAHNDCLYRSMPRFDLVAFNDIDEFIIPHDNERATWSGAFPQLINNSTCGLSFRSAFFDPGVKNTQDSNLLVPRSVSRTKQFSKVRSKVMLVPWRVFEVGIHHISKQNRENWTVRKVDPSWAFLHHYRQCVATFDMTCTEYERDDIVKKRYHPLLRRNYDRAISAIF